MLLVNEVHSLNHLVIMCWFFYTEIKRVEDVPRLTEHSTSKCNIMYVTIIRYNYYFMLRMWIKIINCNITCLETKYLLLMILLNIRLCY